MRKTRRGGAVGTWYYYGNGGGNYATSPDGKNWVTSSYNTGFTDRLAVMVYANNIFVAGGSQSNNPYSSISVSTNGTSWTLKTLPLNGVFTTSVAYGGNGKWVSTNGTTNAYFHYSTNNGSSWANGNPAGGITNAQAVAYGQDGSGAGLWVAGGKYSNLLYSKTGTSWTIVPSDASGGLSQVYSLAYGVNDLGAGLWVATGTGGNKIAYSSNGSSWSKCTVTNGFTTGYGVACGTDNTGKTLWVAVGTGGNKIATSNDGISWTGQAVTAYNPTNILGVMFKPP